MIAGLRKKTLAQESYLAARAKLIYADADRTRTQKVASALKAAGFTVFPCSGHLSASLPKRFARPDLVLLHAEIGEPLRLLVETLWPAVPYRIVSDPEATADLVAQINTALAERPSS